MLKISISKILPQIWSRYSQCNLLHFPAIHGLSLLNGFALDFCIFMCNIIIVITYRLVRIRYGTSRIQNYIILTIIVVKCDECRTHVITVLIECLNYLLLWAHVKLRDHEHYKVVKVPSQ